MRVNRRLARACAFLLGAALTFESPIASAAPHVALIEPEPGDAFLHEAILRLRGELAAVGFEVTAAPSLHHDPRWELEHASAPDTMVTITLRRTDPDEVDAWILDRLSGKTLIRRIHLELGSPAAATVLAVRTTDLLRASLLEVTADDAPPETPSPALPPRAPPPPVVVRWMRPPTPALFARPQVSLGVALLVTPGLRVAAMPTVRVGVGIARGFEARLSAASTLTATTETAAAGSAALEEQLMELELVYALFARGKVVPVASLGAGVFHLSVAGQGSTPAYVGTDTDRFALAVDAGLGLSFRVTDRVSVAVDAHALATLPRERIHLGSDTLGAIGGPSWLTGAHIALAL